MPSDDPETISRREAVVGLSLLGLLMLALVGTMLFRITHPTPPTKAITPAASIVADENDVDVRGESPLRPQQDGEVQAASHAAPESAPADGDAPVFVAPSERYR
jgi:hypothetical protein